MNGIKLKKDTVISLKKKGDDLSKVKVMLNWKTPKNSNTGTMDLDATCFGLVPSDIESKRELFDQEYFVYYENLKTDNESIMLSGDDKTGGEGEEIIVNLDIIPDAIIELAFFVTIHRALKKKQNFSMVEEASISIINIDNDELLAKFDLQNDFSSETAVHFGTIYKNRDGWDFKAIGVGYNSDLADILRCYGVEAE